MTRLVRLIVPVVLLVALWQIADGSGAAGRIARAEPFWLTMALAAVLAQTVLSALRWRLTAGALGLDLPAGRAVSEYFVAQLVNQTLPGGVLGDAARAVRSQDIAGLRPAAEAVVLERLAGQIAMFAWLALALTWSLIFGHIAWPQGTALAFMALVAAAIGAVWLARRARHAAVLATTRAGLFAPDVRFAQVALAAAILALNLAGFACAARATGSTLSPEAVLTLIPLILTAMLIPFGIGGWGWREGAAAALFPLAGLAPAAGLAASATFGATILLAALPGVVLLGRSRRP